MRFTLLLVLVTTSACSSGSSDTSGSLRGGVSASCAPAAAEARAEVDRAFAAAPTSCVADEDCIHYSGSVRCAYDCYGAVVATSAVATLDRTIAQIDARVCTSSCVEPPPPCPLVQTWAACVEGRCASFPPAAWQSISFTQANEAPGSARVPAGCSGDCTLWTLSSDGSLTVVRTTVAGGSTTTTTTLPATSFATVDDILRSVAFRQWEAGGYPLDCAGDTRAEPQLELSAAAGAFGTIGLNITGCAPRDPALAGLFPTLFGIISAP